MNLLQKILIPAALFFVITFAVMIIIFRHYFNQNQLENVTTEIELKKADIDNNINRISNKAVLHSASYSDLKAIKTGLNVYLKTNNLDSASQIIGNKYDELSSGLQKIIGNKFDVAFYSAEGINIYRSWDNQYGDNVISKRNIIRKASIEKKSVNGLENDEWGVAIFGVTPVFDENSQLVGLVETRFPLIQLLKNINIAENEELSILISKQFVDASEKMDINSVMLNYNLKGYIPTILSDKFNIENLKNIKGEINFDNISQTNIENYLYYTLPLEGFGENIIGSIVFQTDITSYLKNKNNANWIIFIFGAIGMLSTMFLMIFIGRFVIKRPVRKVVNSLNLLAEGATLDEMKIKTKDEIGEINNALNKLNKGFRRLSIFAKEIGEGELNSDFETLSEKDEIGLALLDMRHKLVDAKEADEKRQHEDEQRNWATKGFADFGDILRQNNDDIELFSTNIIKNLVKYTGSNQGGLFIINDADKDNVVLDLVSAYAYDRKKFVEKSIILGEGLVGTCGIEKETIYISDVPDNYLNITSGLGKSNPRNILIVPLKLEEEIFGVIELASFNFYDKYQIEFIEKLAESIASSLSTAKINIVTAQLLEQSQQQQEEMKAQEEELRQNMEEMLATQEESARKEAEAEGLYKAVKDNVLLAELDVDGVITDINDNFAKVLESERSKIIGLNYSQLNAESDGISSEEIISKARKGDKVSTKTKVVSASGKEISINQTFTAVVDSDGNTFKIIDLAYIQ